MSNSRFFGLFAQTFLVKKIRGNILKADNNVYSVELLLLVNTV